jgi:hypothetical protein
MNADGALRFLGLATRSNVRHEYRHSTGRGSATQCVLQIWTCMLRYLEENFDAPLSPQEE